MDMDRARVGWLGRGAARARGPVGLLPVGLRVACVGLAVVALAACQEEVPPKTLRAPSPPEPRAVAAEPEAIDPSAAEAEEPDRLFVLEQVNSCFDDLEQSLLSMPVDQRLGAISGASTTVFQCSTQAITAEGYEITEDAVQVIRNAMRERTPGLTQKLMEM